LDTLSFRQIRVEFSDADVLQLELGMTLIGERQIGIGTEASGRSLLDFGR
jgi:hypothetical protein